MEIIDDSNNITNIKSDMIMLNFFLSLTPFIPDNFGKNIIENTLRTTVRGKSTNFSA